MKYFVTSRLSENIHETPEGFLVCVGVSIARTGEMIYGRGESPIEVGPDGKAIIVREAKEVFRPETMASFEGKPFTLNHPEDFVNPKNWKVLAKGTIQNVRRGSGVEENDVVADILVTDEEAIKLVKGGLREVSCGYEAEYTQLGIGRGMQTNIIGNHLALVEEGRAGAAYAINDQAKGAKMKAIGEKIKGIFARAGDEAAKVVDESGDEKTKVTDEMPAWAKDLQKQVKDAITQMGSMSQPTKMGDEEEEKKKADDAEKEGEEKKAEDEAPAWAKDMVKCMNAMMEKLSGKKADDAEGEKEDESEDAEGEEEESKDSEDDDFEETPAAVGDEAARIEILAPGLKAKGKDAKRLALVTAYKSKDHKVIIDTLNGGKAVDFKKASTKTIDHLFIGASEMIGLARTKDFSKWKQVRDSSASEGGEPMSAAVINEINEKHYAAQRSH